MSAEPPEGLPGYISQRLDGAGDAIGSTAIGRELIQLKDKLANQAEEFANEKKRLFDQWKEEKKMLLFNFIQEKLEGIFDHGMNVAAEVLKEKIKDPYMPQFVKNLCDDLVDGIWPDVKTELKDAVLKEIAPQQIIAHGEPPCCPCSPYAYLRYVLYPYDRGVWRQMRHPIWWLFMLASMVPKYGVYAIVYLIIFLLIDKSDEYQLYQFIVDFKSLQFLTIGIIGAGIGSAQYFVCTSREPNTCESDSPQESFWTMMVFVAQVLVVFVAFLLMNCSEKKGGFYYQMEQDSKSRVQETTRRENRTSILRSFARDDGSEDDRARLVAQLHYKSEQELLENSTGRLMKFLIWDLVAFIISVALVCLLAYYNRLDEAAQVNRHPDSINDGNWKFTMGMWLIKTFYGFLSFPFVILRLPVISTLISHARPTGYNPYGNTVPLLGKEEQRSVPWDPERGEQTKMV